MRLPPLPNYDNWLDSAYDFYYNDYLNDRQNEGFEQHPSEIDEEC